MSQLKSVVNTTEIHEGDTFAVTVVFHVGENYLHKKGAKFLMRAYRCHYPDAYVTPDGIPQGDQIDPRAVDTLAKALVPVLGWNDVKADPT